MRGVGVEDEEPMGDRWQARECAPEQGAATVPMRNFCTLFDANYLTRGVLMHRSLMEAGEPFTLYVVCFDPLSLQVLQRLALPHLVPIALEEFESPPLREVKKSRSRAEYCWTCASHVIRYVLERFRLEEVTYLDADLFFYRPPSSVLAEYDATEGSVLLTEHRFAPLFESHLEYGRYCVQFVTFRNDRRGREALDWWCERTLEWCHDRLEDGRFGDQKYLDDWLERFEGVRVSSHIGAGVANWNVRQYRVAGSSEAPTVDGVPVLFFHFHMVKLFVSGRIDLGYLPLPREAVEILYLPYLRRLATVEREVALLCPGFATALMPDRHPLARAISYLYRKAKGNYHVVRVV
ncbi:hypothetical protein LPW11_17760 [Geomonas sp. RF6]|uniref:hypothetical protein n=1 Tax=Geomonas sp. RF6 TaxID=2897342 RepID=UPI001E5025A0|nr:hypothetical protein [Geomonas sp. RF6]UFS69728.1 hypothetical protein LPW11_17760 [Geomonas sp. RF6]